VQSEDETIKVSGLGNYFPSLEISGQILQVLEGKPWAPDCTDLLLKALEITNFPETAVMHIWVYVIMWIRLLMPSVMGVTKLWSHIF
jgi:hypothetical protein